MAVTWRPETTGSNLALSNGNLTVANNVSNGLSRQTWANQWIGGGKWYWEVTVTLPASPGVMALLVGVTTSEDSYAANYLGAYSQARAMRNNGNKVWSGSSASYGNAFASGDVVGVALDQDNKSIWFSINGVWQASGDPAAGSGAAFADLHYLGVAPACTPYDNGASAVVNFGDSAFAYAPPAGFSALSTFVQTARMPDPGDPLRWEDPLVPQAFNGLLVPSRFLNLKDMEHGGIGRVRGTVTIDGTPGSRKVRLLDARSGVLVREQWSAADGSYAFNNIRLELDYVVLSHDHTGVFNAVVQDRVRAELMP